MVSRVEGIQTGGSLQCDMATVKRFTIIRTVIVLCSVTAIALPGILLYEQDNGGYHAPLGRQQYIKFPTRRPILSRKSMLVDAQNSRRQDRQPVQGELLGSLGNFMVPVLETKLADRDRYQQIRLTAVDAFSESSSKKRTGDFNPNFPRREADDGVYHDKPRIGSDSKSHGLQKTQRKLKTLNGSLARGEKKCQEVLKVAFLKTHKTGSTTIMNVIQRFGHVRNLVFALPKSTNYLGFGETVTPHAVLPAPRGKTYDLLINHVVYNREAFMRIMPKETTYVTIIRHPFEQFVSAIEYLKERVGYLKKLPKENPVSEFLRNSSHYETSNVKWSFTNNRMSFDLGLDHKLYRNADKVKQFIHALDQDFKLVMITEHVEESLLLLKKLLCWNFKDILYIPRNVNLKKRVYNFTDQERQLHRTLSPADYLLYEYFLEKFQRRVAAEGPVFVEELKFFKNLLSRVREHCLTKNYRVVSLKIEATKWNEAFEIMRYDCLYMLLEEVPFLQRTKTQYIHKLQGYGVNRWHVNTQHNRLRPVRPPIHRRRVNPNNRRRPQYRRVPRRSK